MIKFLPISSINLNPISNLIESTSISDGTDSWGIIGYSWNHGDYTDVVANKRFHGFRTD